MISPNRKAYLFIIEEICNKDTGIFNMDVYNLTNNELSVVSAVICLMMIYQVTALKK